MSQQYQPQIYPYINVPIHPDSNIPSQSSSSSHSNGSFGTVFLVLGVILVVSVLACIANRLCRKRSNHHDHMPKDMLKSHDRGPRGHGKLPREWEGRQSREFHQEGGDLEFGKRIPSAKVAAGGDGPSISKPYDNGGGKGARFVVHHMELKP